MTQNTHKVSAKQWRRWHDDARQVFNQVYPQLFDGYTTGTLLPPSLAVVIGPKAARVIAWNSAWLAADAAHLVALKYDIKWECKAPPKSE